MSNKETKKTWFIFALITSLFVLATQLMGKIFFINRTASMPIGVYIKKKFLDPAVGDIIVFKTNSYKRNLIKYIAATANDDYCFDENGTLWLKGIPAAQKNIEKYPEALPTQSICHTLKPNELLVSCP